MKWIKRILAAEFIEEKQSVKKKQKLKVKCGSSSWGTLDQISPDGSGYIIFDGGGGQLIRNWDHFFELIEVCESENI